jgi:flagellar protein FliS
MFAQPRAEAYRQNQVLQASPVQIVVMLYDRAILLLRTASRCMREGRVQEKSVAVCKTVDIITELQTVLDKQKGGEIAKRLDSLYAYSLDTLTIANYDNDVEKIDEIAGLLEELRFGWKDVDKPVSVRKQ